MALAEYLNPGFKLVMLVNINPSKGMTAETTNVLDYANTAKEIAQWNILARSRSKGKSIDSNPNV